MWWRRGLGRGDQSRCPSSPGLSETATPSVRIPAFTLHHLSPRSWTSPSSRTINMSRMHGLSLALMILVLRPDQAEAIDSLPRTVEVFVDTAASIEGQSDPRLRNASVSIYRVDGVATLERQLSDGLPNNEEAAKAQAISRLDRIAAADRDRAKEAALGLLLVLRYGVDRYPAIVFDGRVIVYGMTDLGAALDHAALAEHSARQ